MTDKATLANLKDHERGMLLQDLQELHPKILQKLLDRTDRDRRRDAERAAMPEHPFEQEGGIRLCVWHYRTATCLRYAGDPLHVPAASA